MTYRGFKNRLFIIALTTWFVGAIMESFLWGFFYAVLPFLFWEMVRRR